MSPLAHFQCDHELLLVILSYTISVLGAYCALQWAAQIPPSRGRTRAVWLAGAAVAMGGGAIWSMHFIAMIACRLPVPVAFDVGLTVASLLVAVAVTGIGLHLASRGREAARRLFAGGIITGLGVAAMHYTGMAAMRLSAETTYRPGLVAASILIAVVAATVALWIAFNLGGGWIRLVSSLVMGVAVCGMHYTAMAAAVFVPNGKPAAVSSHALGSDDLAYLVFGVTLLVLTLLSAGGRALRGNLSIAARISILTGVGTLVALGGTLALLSRMQDTVARDLQMSRSRHEQVEMARGLQLSFKKQVQEWKNVLLRGHDSGDFDKYRQSFLDEERVVQTQGRALVGMIAEPSTRSMAAHFLDTHRDLGKSYRAALETFTRSGNTDYQSADRMMRGADRAPSDLLDEIVRSIEADFQINQASQTAELLRQRRYTALVAAILFSGLVLVGLWIARRITSPILDLSQLVSRVSSERDYALRVPRRGSDEVALLADGFNEMLSQIERRNAALQEAQNELEQRVEQRTGELQKVNSELGAEITERERSHAERARIAAFTSEISAAFTRRETLAEALSDCARALVNHLGAATASLWTVSASEDTLELQGCAGFGSVQPEFESRVPIGRYRLGRIARDRRPMLSVLAEEQPAEDDKDWARNAGMVSFAGYPLMLRNRVVGVLAMFAEHRLGEATVETLASVAEQIAIGISRFRAVEALVASDARTRSIIDNMLEGLVIVDRENRIRSINPAGERIFGYATGELLGQPLSLLVPDTSGVSTEFLRAARVQSLGKVTEWEGKRKNGECFPVELSLFEFWTSQGRLFGGAVKDLSERREVERLKREFVSSVSHELRTPLTSIRGALGLVAGGAAGPLPPQAKSLLDIALKNSERLTRLVNDILDMEKIEAGQLEFRIEELELEALVAAAVDANRAYGSLYGVSLAIESGAPDARVRADGDRLTQVLTNLISNAVKYSPPEGTVRLVTSRRKDSVRLEVVDRGPGIPEEFRSRIFGRFQQADSSDTRQKGGTGLGLAITRLIVEQLGGTIGFETEIGRGTAFWVELPEIGFAAAHAAAPSAAGGARALLLHVDDDPDLPQIVAAALAADAVVDVARDVREAREKLSRSSYDLVILDVGLPDGSGLELRHHLQRPGGDRTPYVLFTASEIPREAAGTAAAVLIKSRSSVDALVRSVRSVLAQATQDRLEAETAR